MASTETYYFDSNNFSYPYAFMDPNVKQHVYFDARSAFLWGVYGEDLIKMGYPAKTSPEPDKINDFQYTGYYYLEYVFKSGSRNMASLSTMGSA